MNPTPLKMVRWYSFRRPKQKTKEVFNENIQPSNPRRKIPCIFATLKRRENTSNMLSGLKIFTTLSRCFQDFRNLAERSNCQAGGLFRRRRTESKRNEVQISSRTDSRKMYQTIRLAISISPPSSITPKINSTFHPKPNTPCYTMHRIDCNTKKC